MFDLFLCKAKVAVVHIREMVQLTAHSHECDQDGIVGANARNDPHTETNHTMNELSLLPMNFRLLVCRSLCRIKAYVNYFRVSCCLAHDSCDSRQHK
jgi:hypothetical protein